MTLELLVQPAFPVWRCQDAHYCILIFRCSSCSHTEAGFYLIWSQRSNTSYKVLFTQQADLGGWMNGWMDGWIYLTLDLYLTQQTQKHLQVWRPRGVSNWEREGFNTPTLLSFSFVCPTNYTLERQANCDLIKTLHYKQHMNHVWLLMLNTTGLVTPSIRLSIRLCISVTTGPSLTECHLC